MDPRNVRLLKQGETAIYADGLIIKTRRISVKARFYLFKTKSDLNGKKSSIYTVTEDKNDVIKNLNYFSKHFR